MGKTLWSHKYMGQAKKHIQEVIVCFLVLDKIF